jgi:hypothetical protein
VEPPGEKRERTRRQGKTKKRLRKINLIRIYFQKHLSSICRFLLVIDLPSVLKLAAATGKNAVHLGFDFRYFSLV